MKDLGRGEEAEGAGEEGEGADEGIEGSLTNIWMMERFKKKYPCLIFDRILGRKKSHKKWS